MLIKGFKGFLIAAAISVLLFLIMHWDVKQGVKNYTRTHPVSETLSRKGSIDIFNTGESFYEKLFEDIKQGREHIWIHFFIIRDDEITKELFGMLIEKAQEGVDVRLSVDYLGSDIQKKTVKKMEEGGVKVVKSRPLNMHNVFYSLHHRNHRRLISIDQRIGYIGGFNMGDEYLGKDPKLGYWRDYHIRIFGEAVGEISQQFKRDWEEDGGESIKLSFPVHATTKKDGSRVHFLFSTGDGLVDKTIHWINEAKESVTITTPYFIPNVKLTSALKDAVNRGVKVNILVPDDTDAWFTKPPSYRIEKSLLDNGVNLYLYEKGFFHGKVMVIDHEWADVGTANWDPRSFHLNDESNAIVQDVEVARELERLIDQDIQDSEKLTKKAFDELPFWEIALRKTPKWLYYYF
ncbi:cardiolipin synthase [Bacillus sp. BHET2]|uniref:cardiolipin synthase n=1 Tax=Bacillus sp. BHET2 TaxID=2583818 RepID=UPI00110EC7E6|nr:cardiolipin synthase [Bacillus sp. BHET2]TMU87631.1 cardiolipin synthase [Bacillus sp. BHET2]